MNSLRFSTRSLRRRASATFGIVLLTSMVACGGAGDESAVGAPQTPVIIGAPASRQAIVGQQSSFVVEGQGAGLAFAWEEQRGGNGEWRTSHGSVTSDGFVSNLVVGPVDIGMDKTRFRGRVSNNAGSALSAEARMDVVWGTVSTLEPTSIDFGPGAGGMSGADGGSPGGGDGEGVGVGGGLGKTPRAVIALNRVADGASLGSAAAGSTSGIVRVKAGPGAVPVVVTLTGAEGATYYDEGRDAMLPLGVDQQLHALVLSFDRHLGVTTLTEAAYRYALNHFLQDPAAVRAGAVPLKRTATAQELARLTPTQIQLANEAIRNAINRLAPPRYAIDSISTLPTPVDNTSPQGAISDNIYGRMQAVVGGLSLAAARFEPSLANPALLMNEQLVDDLTDGVVDGQALDQRSVFGPTGTNAYAPGNLAQRLADAADAQFERFGDGAVQQAPVITRQPRAAEITDGGTATLNVEATGSLLTFQWFRDGNVIPGATRPELATQGGGEYYVEIANDAAKVRSNRVTVIVVGTTRAPSITTQPQSTMVASGESANFNVAATGTNLRYQWQIVSSPTSASDIAGATSSSYSTGTAGTYRVIVRNEAASATSQDATLAVTERVIAPQITRQPTSRIVVGGEPVTLQVEASGHPLHFQWHRERVPIDGATTSSWMTTTAGTYHVLVSNSRGSEESDHVSVIVVTRPTITTQPASVTIDAGQTATLTVVASGTSLRYQWQRDGAALDGANSASYSSGTGGSYTVVVNNDWGAQTSSAAVVTVASSPVIVTHPQSVEILQGQTATLSVVAGGSSPLQYQWRRDGNDISGATASSYSAGTAGTYRVEVSNSRGAQTSNPATVAVVVPPTITMHPTSASVPQGATHTLTITATGSQLLYQWQQSSTEGDWTDIPNAVQPTYQTDAAGTYRAVVRNRAGARESDSATLTVAIGLPVISDISVVCLSGVPCEWAARATSATPVTWQWYQVYNSGASLPIPGATAPNFRPQFLGSVNYVVVTNPTGPTTGPLLTWRY